MAKRSVLTAEEYSIPYHLDYYQHIRKRTQDLIAAQYSDDFTEVRKFIIKYHPDFWLIDKTAFEVNYLQNNNWLRQFTAETETAIALLQEDKQPALLTTADKCSIFSETNLILLDTKCILQALSS